MQGKNVKNKWKGSDRIRLAQDREQWQGVLKMAMEILFVLFIPFHSRNLYIQQQIQFKDDCYEFYFIICLCFGGCID